MHNLINTAWNFNYTVIMAESREDLQAQLKVFGEYFQKWKLKVNVEKIKISFFLEDGLL